MRCVSFKNYDKNYRLSHFINEQTEMSLLHNFFFFFFKSNTFFDPNYLLY